MINSSKIFRLSPNQQGLLTYINPWWDAQLTKIIKQQRGWLRRFGQATDQYFPTLVYSYDEYPQLIKNVNHLLNFYEAKTKAILKMPRAVSKFRRWYQQTESLKAILSGIINLTAFYEAQELGSIANKRTYLINQTNDFLMNSFHHYQHVIKAMMPEETHETLDQIYKNVVTPEHQFFNPTLVFNLVYKYANRLVKLKKINEETFVNLWFRTISIATFFETYVKFQNRLLTSITCPA